MPIRRILLNGILPVAFIAAIGWYVWRERAQLEPLGEAPLTDLLLIAALVAGAHFLNSTEFWLSYRAQGVATGVFENWRLFLAGNLGNYLPAQAGALYRLRYMRSVHDASYAQSVAALSANLIATLGGGAAAGLFGSVVLTTTTDTPPTMMVVFLGIAAVCVAALWVPLPAFLERTGRIARAWRSFQEGLDQVRRSPRRSALMIAMEAGKYVLTAWRFQIAFSLLDVHQPFWFFLALAPAAGFAQFVSFTPGALGFREGFLATSTVLLDAPFSVGLLAATADRAVMLATSVVLGALGFASTYPALRRAELSAPPAGAPAVPRTPPD